MILVKMRVHLLGAPARLALFAAPDDVVPTFENISAFSRMVAMRLDAGWTAHDGVRASPADAARYDKLPLFLAASTVQDGHTPDAGEPPTPLCQACELYGEHVRCTGETTLGTKACGCPCRSGRRP